MIEYLYIHWSECGVPLYVGRTTNPAVRYRQHVAHSRSRTPGRHRRSRWMPAVARVELIEVPAGRPGWVEERNLIERLSPRFNVADRGLEYGWAAQRKRMKLAELAATTFTDRDVRLLAAAGRRSPAHLSAIFDALEAAA